VRGITGTLVTLCIVGYVAAVMETPQVWSNATTKPVNLSDGWRRTATGWEWNDDWVAPPQSQTDPPAVWRLHPATLAAGQILFSLLALIWADRTRFGRTQHAAAKPQPASVACRPSPSAAMATPRSTDLSLAKSLCP